MLLHFCIGLGIQLLFLQAIDAIHVVIWNLKFNKHYLIYRNPRNSPQKSTSTQRDSMLHITKSLLLDPLQMLSLAQN